MNVLLINSVCGILSTGRIVTDIADEYIAEGHTCRIAYGRGDVPEKYKDITYKIGSDFSVRMNAVKARFLDNEGFNAKRATSKFLKWLDDFKPDLIWLHNLHGYYINVELLFEWIKKNPQIEVKWTLHDCWTFTGHCPHFIVAQCNKWISGCERCIQKQKYPKSLFVDNSKQNYLNKKNSFCNVERMKLITPSNWLADLVKQSFLKNYPIEVIYNSIDEDCFKFIESNFKEDYGVKNKKIVLGVASSWVKSKGLDDFIELSRILDDSYCIVLVGISPKVKKKLPKNILAIEKTNSKETLAKIYSAADVFVNPSKEETFGMTTLEAICCGTYAIVYKGTACEEVINYYGHGEAVGHSVQEINKAIQKNVAYNM